MDMTKNQVIVNKPNLLHVHFDLQWIKNTENTNLKNTWSLKDFSTSAKPLSSFLTFFPSLNTFHPFVRKFVNVHRNGRSDVKQLGKF
jgi:hypothetical protein